MPLTTLSKYAMRSILGHLADAALALEKHEPRVGNSEGQGAWHLRCARDRLLEVALADIAVEPIADEDSENAAWRESRADAYRAWIDGEAVR